jgi:GH25 family lysozyme M1 (1,4-beta-N-acetylmuramidase)
MIAIDISYWQHSPDFAKVRAAGVGLVIMKMGGAEPGHLYFDSVYKANRAAARAVGLAVGSYFFNGAVNPTDAANFQMNNADWKPGDIVALDVENATNVARWNPAQVLEWCKAVRARGVPANRILVYMSSSVTRAANWSAVAALGVGLWVAQYGTNNGTPQGSPSIAYWSSWALWQYTSAKTWPGIVGNVDTNQVSGSWVAGGGTPIGGIMLDQGDKDFINLALAYVVRQVRGTDEYAGDKLTLNQLRADIGFRDGALAKIQASVDAATEAIKAIPAGGPGQTVDLSGLLTAIQSVPTAAQNGDAARAAIVK